MARRRRFGILYHRGAAQTSVRGRGRILNIRVFVIGGKWY